MIAAGSASSQVDRRARRWHRRESVKALIKVGYACNENCTFCHTADVRHLNDTGDRVAWKIDRAKRLGYSMVVLSGGEPTIRPELRSWARRVAGHGLDLGLVT